MTALLFPVVPAMDSPFWQVQKVPATVVRENGCNIHLDHWLKVQRARLVLDLSALPPTGRAAGGER